MAVIGLWVCSGRLTMLSLVFVGVATPTPKPVYRLDGGMSLGGNDCGGKLWLEADHEGVAGGDEEKW